ncbi:MAG: T9SS type A sorting domain-containing protein [Cyclobacteriaceae bacterium]|nr:T9SS type A sorting domain-containing protein [Cyclobacteriaceae bacterium]
MRFVLSWLVALTFFSSIHAQTAGDFRSVAGGGDWNTSSTWEQFNGTSWVPSVITPASVNGTININSPVIIPSGFTVVADQLVLTAQLQIASGGQLTLADGAGVDLIATDAGASLTVNGTLLRSNATTISSLFDPAKITFTSGSLYLHNYTTTFGDLPAATWDPLSTIQVNAFTNNITITADASWNQTIGNFLYNCPGQRGLVDFSGLLSTIRGDFTVQSTGNNILQLSSDQDPTITIGSNSSSIGGDVSISGTSRVNFSTSGLNTIVNIFGDFNFSSTNTNGTNLTLTGTCTVELFGNFNMNSGTGRLHFANAGTTGVGTLNLRSNFNLISGRLDELGSNPTQGNINFVGLGEQLFVNTGTITGFINYTIPSTSTVNLGTSALVGSSPSAFTLSGTIILGSLDTLGAIQNNSRGNIRTPVANRTYNPGSTVIFRGQNTMFLGSAHPSSANLTTVIDNNPFNVRLANNATINGILTLASGSFELLNRQLTSGGTLQSAGGTFSGTTQSRLIIQPTTPVSWGTLVFEPSANTLEILTINSAGSSVNLNSSLVIASQFNLLRGDLNNTSGLALENGATLTRYNPANLLGSSPIITAGTYNLVYRTFSVAGGPFADFTTGLEFTNNATDIGNVTVNLAQTADILRLSQNLTINGTVLLTRGLFSANAQTLTMQGASWIDNGGNFSPTAGGLIVFNGTTQVSGSSTPAFGSIQLNATRTLEFTRNVSLQGDVTFASGSTFIMGNNTVILGGGNVQTISVNGAVFSNITVSKSGGAGVSLTSPLNLIGILQFTSPSANVNFNSNGNLTLVSTSDNPGSGTAMIYRLASGNTVTGDVTVQRYMSGEGRIYRYISSPVTNATVAQWKDDFLITGNFLDPSPRQNLCGFVVTPTSPSLFFYNETVPGTVDNGYIQYPFPGQSTATSPIQVGLGYATFIRQCALPTIVDVTGPINFGLINLPVTYTSSTIGADGYNLVGNPYPCAVSWINGGWTKTRISSVISVMDNGSGFMRYYDAGVVEDIPQGRIASGQAFWVRATAANPILRINESTKTNVVPEFFRTAGPTIPSFVMSLSNGSVEDKTYVKIVSGALPTLDEFDAPKISNPTFSFSTISADDIPMAINAYNNFDCGLEVKLGIKDLVAGNYSIQFDDRGFFGEYDFVLLDYFTNEEVVISNTNGYSFSVTADPLTAAFDRFSLSIQSKRPSFEAIEIEAPAAMCKDVASVEISLSQTEEGIEYSIFDSEGALLAAEQTGTGNALVFTVISSKLKTGLNAIEVKAKNACSTVISDQKPTITINDVPTPTISIEGQNLISSYAVGNQWYLNREKIEGATDPLLTADVSGYYSVVVTVEGCEATAGIDFLVTGINEWQAGAIRVYPNPATDHITIESLDPNVIINAVKLYDNKGVEVRARNDSKNLSGIKTNILYLSELPAGLYMVRIFETSKITSVKVLKK